MKRALTISRSENFSKWYIELIKKADLAENSAVRGCMVIKPQGYGIWERMQQELDWQFKETGHENCYFPLFIPLEFMEKEADHVEGFAKEMAVVTHHRLVKGPDGGLIPDPKAKLQEPLIIRPTSELIIGDSFKKWIRTHKDLPILVNQWANVVRWEMRTRLFLRTAEFLWQEGHTAHANKAEAMIETLKMLEVYREFSENIMAMPVIAGEKPKHERFAGAENTYSIEAIMQDGRALQAGTSHYLGTKFAQAQGITYRSADQQEHFVHTTSWGVSTRLIGGLIMSHGDDDGLRIPPALAPQQIVIIPILRGKSENSAVLDYCAELKGQLKALTAFGRPIRVHLDLKDRATGDKRWDWIRRGVPLLIEVGQRDVEAQTVSFIRRDKLHEGDSLAIAKRSRADFAGESPQLLADIQSSLYQQAEERTKASIVDGPEDWNDVESYYGTSYEGDEEDAEVDLSADVDQPTRGWIRASWCRPEGVALEAVLAQLKRLHLSIRVAPQQQPASFKRCIFTGEPGKEEIFIARSY